MSATVSGPTSHDDHAELRALAASDPLAVMRACHDRRLEREGIPMILGLADERGRMPEGTPAQREEGAALASVLEGYRDALVPWARDDDKGALITAMQVLAVTHLDPAATTTDPTATDRTEEQA